MVPLPIDPVLPALGEALGAVGAAVLQAPPGAGKTTRAPLFLLGAPWLGARKIVMLEPRRLAARAAARRMASELGEPLGHTVGYRVRRDVVAGPATRIEVVTEGILTRMLQSDPALEGAGLVIFDEFHERSLQGDLGLALALQSRRLLRDDLRLLVMSATLEGAPVAAALGGAPIITGAGQGFPVETRYRPRRAEQHLDAAVAAVVREALADCEGDVLVFLPGQAEIRRVEERLGDVVGAEIMPLFGNLSPEGQDRAIAPGAPGRRKVVLATSIAETSLTIEGVRAVVDAGLARVPAFSPRSGMTHLKTVRVSRASADQRRGRAGRTAPGVCYRLWAEAEDPLLLPRAAPEILEADLAPLALELAAAGIQDPGELTWLDPPPAAALAEARLLLRELDALDVGSRLTPHGRQLARLGTHPRLAHLLLRGAAAGELPTAARLVALLEERDILHGEHGPPDPDLRLRLELLEAQDAPTQHHGMTVDRGALVRVRREARAWEHAVRRPASGRRGDAGASAGLLLALAYPDRIGQRRPGQAGRYLLRNGLGAFTEAPGLLLADWIVGAELDGDRRESRLWLAAPVTLPELLAVFGGQVETEEVVAWDDGQDGVVAVRRERLGAIVVRETPVRDPDGGRISDAVIGWIARTGLDTLPWGDAANSLRSRMRFLAAGPGAMESPGGWPDVGDAALIATLQDWLAPHLAGVRRRADLARIDLTGALLGLLDWRRRQALDQLAPTHLQVPSGSRIALRYDDPANPILAVRLQEVFGMAETPRIAGGRVPVTLELLSPARRPVQVTRDLAGFWRTGYFDVRRELRGRYPRHDWPEDPLAAPPRKGARPRT